jgi:hypothetical protein
LLASFALVGFLVTHSRAALARRYGTEIEFRCDVLQYDHAAVASANIELARLPNESGMNDAAGNSWDFLGLARLHKSPRGAVQGAFPPPCIRLDYPARVDDWPLNAFRILKLGRSDVQMTPDLNLAVAHCRSGRAADRHSTCSKAANVFFGARRLALALRDDEPSIARYCGPDRIQHAVKPAGAALSLGCRFHGVARPHQMICSVTCSSKSPAR